MDVYQENDGTTSYNNHPVKKLKGATNGHPRKVQVKVSHNT